MSGDNTFLNEQVNRLDREVATLTTSQASLVKTVGELAGNVNTMSTDMREGFAKLAEERATSSKTNWQTITSIASVFLLIVGGLYGLVSSSAADGRADNASDIQEMKQMFYEHAKGGHPDSVIEKVNSLKLSLEKQMTQINGKAERALLDLQSRSGKRFNREDHDKYVLPRFQDIEAQVRILQLGMNDKQRFTRDDWQFELTKLMKLLDDRKGWMENQTMIDAKQTADIEWLVEKVSDLKKTMERIAKLETLIERISAEQVARTNRVYSDTK